MAHNYQVHEMSSDDFHTLAMKGWKTPQWGVALVTYEPWLCDYLLGNKCHNRPVSPAELGRLKAVLQEVRWLRTGETLIFTAAFENVDGQHRLTAGKETNVSFTSLTVWGVERDVFVAIDIGKKRSAADQLAANSILNSSAMAAALRVHYRLEQHAMRKAAVSLPDDEIFDYYADHKEMRYSIGYGERIKQFVLPSVGSPLHYLFRAIDNTLADVVYDQLSKGEQLTHRDPFFVLREFLGTQRHKKYPGRHNMDEKSKADMAAQVIEAWNAVRRQKTITPKWLREVDQRDFPDIL